MQKEKLEEVEKLVHKDLLNKSEITELLMGADPEELKSRLEQDENFMLKIQVQMNALEGKLLNQMAEYGKEILRLQKQLTNLKRKLK